MRYIPNILTITRIFLTVIFVFYIQQGGLRSTVLGVLAFAAAAFSDYLDGYFARKYEVVSVFGKIMDPIADKFLILSAFYVFAGMDVFAWWMFWVIFAREVLVTLSRFWAMKKGAVIAAEKSGKYKTVLQIVAISVMLILRLIGQTSLKIPLIEYYFEWWLVGIQVLMYATVALTVYSGVSYFWNNRKVLYA